MRSMVFQLNYVYSCLMVNYDYVDVGVSNIDDYAYLSIGISLMSLLVRGRIDVIALGRDILKKVVLKTQTLME